MRLVVVLLVLVPALAVAQPGMTPPLSPEPAPAAPVKDGATATLLAIGATAGSVLVLATSKGDLAGGIGLGGLLVGPALGHIYAGESSHMVASSLVRAIALGTFIYGIVLIDNSAGDCEFVDGPCGPTDDHQRGVTRMWIGGTVFVGATLYDWYDAHRAAQRANDRHRLRVMPAVIPGGGPGFVLGGRF